MLKDAEATKKALIQWIRDYFQQNGPQCSAVVGISGGKDSTIVAALCKEALGANRVVGVLMPNGVQSDIDDARAVVKHLDIPYVVVNIGESYKALTSAIVKGEHFSSVTKRTELSRDALINMPPPRLRMATLYAIGRICRMERALPILVTVRRTMWDTLQNSGGTARGGISVRWLTW